MGIWIDELNQEQEGTLRDVWQEILTDEAFKELIPVLWSFVMGDDPDRLLLRFIRARKWDTKNAAHMLERCVKWRLEFNVAGVTEQSLPLEEHQSGKFYFHKTCKAGRPIGIVHVRIHEKDSTPADDLNRWCIYQMEAGRRLLVPPNEKVTLIFNMTGFSLKNMDYNFVGFLAKCFEAYYPESLGACLIVNSPWLFSGCWRIISPWLDPIVRAKIQFISSDKLLDFIDKENLEEGLGGADPYVFNYIPPTPQTIDENEKSKNEEEKRSLLKEFAENTTWLVENWGTEDSKQKSLEEACKKRNDLKVALRNNYLDSCKYREQTLYHRMGVIRDNERTCKWD